VSQLSEKPGDVAAAMRHPKLGQKVEERWEENVDISF
jgi:hypothetical protein